MKRLKSENLNLKEFYPKYLQLVNVILPKPLTNKEIEILTAFMELRGDIEEDRFGTQARKIVRERFGFKKHSNLDNYIKYFKNKGIILVDEVSGKLEISKRLAIPKDEKEVELIFKFKINGKN